jgi:class 3 adenylate cyclase/tetratricopeptide (TPR) repeat protein/regulation of enolase protein 1 (concanavalin A-like superfamily)
MGTIPHTPGGMGTIPHTPGGMGTIPHTPGGMGTIPHTPGGMGTIPHTPGGMGKIPHTPGGMGTIPHTPGEMGTIPHTPGGMGTIPHTPGEMGTIPHTPGRMGKIPHTPEEAESAVETGHAVSVPEVSVPKLEDVHAKLRRSMPRSLAAQMQTDAGAEGENRILSILFADVSGSVAVTENMSPEDAADLISECLKAMVDIILKYNGTINRFLGDSVLAFFGIPETHENDPERAILAALEMRDAVTDLNLSISIGINTGMVYVGSIGPDSHSEFTAMGTAVNLAARLEREAEPGQILVGEATYRPTRRSFEFNALAPLTIRGITEPVSAYEVVKQSPRPGKIRGIEGLRVEMIGREKEFADLKDCVDELLTGRGQIVSVIGEAGVGKSRLVAELREYLDKRLETSDLRQEGRTAGLKSHVSSLVSILEGRCVSIGESIGYWVFIDILRSYLEYSGEHDPEHLQERILDRMKALFPERWEEIVPYIGNLLSVRFREWDDRIRYMPPEQMKYQTFLTLRDVFLALAQQRPLLVILEDLHWADNLSLDLLNLLMDDLRLAPMMLLCVYRPDREHRSWHIGAQASGKCPDRYTEITLRPLNPHESRRLVESLLSIENLPETVKESILQKAEGNPFFVEEVIRSLIESGVVYQDGERWLARGEVEDIAVPETVQSVIMARIDRLEDEVRYVLQSAAVIGRLFRHKLLRYTIQQEQNLDRHLWRLEEKGLVYEERAIPELEYSFQHVLTQETAYNTILSRRRREFHRKVGEGYEALYSSRIEEYYEELAYHYSRSDDEQKALHYLVKAGDKSREAFANEEAISYYSRALELMDTMEEDAEGDACVAPTIGHIYHSLGEIYFSLTKYEEALECCQKALEYTTDNKRRAGIYGLIGFMHQRKYNDLGKYEELDTALEYLKRGIAELGDDTECWEMARLSIPLFWVALGQGDTEEAIEIALRGLKIVEGTEHYFEGAELCRSLAWVYDRRRRRDLDKELEYTQKALEIAQKSGSINLIGRCFIQLGRVHRERNEDDAAIESLRRGIQITRKIGDNFHLARGYRVLSWIYDRREDWDSAIECLERSLAISPVRPYDTYWLARAYFRKGDVENACKIARKALEFGEVQNSTIVTAFLGLLEESFASAGKRGEFISYCRELGEEKGDAFRDLGLVQWHLEPRELSGHFIQTAFVEEFDGPGLRSEWEWVNPGGDSSYSLSRASEGNWLEVHAASGAHLYDWENFDAPRLLQEISGDFAVETRMKAASDNLPSVGGILIWKDQENFIRFERGMHFENEIRFAGSVRDEYVTLGRGMLASDVLYLRLERMGDRLSAYCSSDGSNWFICGQVKFPIEDPIQVGVHAIGGTGFRGGSMDTATRVDYFRVLRRAWGNTHLS